MQLVDVVPLTNIPRPNPSTFSYYYAQPLARFSLVEVSIGKRKHPALVLGSRSVTTQKADIRKADFLLRPLSRVLHSLPVLFEWQFSLAQWMSAYYWFSLGAVVKKFIPPLLATSRRPLNYPLASSDSLLPQTLVLVPDGSFFEGEKKKRLLSTLNIDNQALFVSSRLTPKKHLEAMRALASGEASLAIGTRAGLFVPFLSLREIVIIEELDRNHASWDQKPKFHAVTMAKEAARLTGAKLRFYSTVPSLESFFHRVPFSPLNEGKGAKPNLQLVDLTKEVQKGPLAPETLSLCKSQLLAKKRVILYINRRGEARFLLCRDCGHVPRCDRCDLPFVYHRKPRPLLLCHHCAKTSRPPSVCAQCGSHEIRYYGFGSERVQKELESAFQGVRVYRLDSDVLTKDCTKDDIVKAFERDGDFLVATSMLFQTDLSPAPSLIVVSSESEMNIPHFDAYERLLFTLARLRTFASETMLVQAYNVDDPIFASLDNDDRRSFYQEELEHRRLLSYPPFSQVIKLIYKNKKQKAAEEGAEILLKKLEHQFSLLCARERWNKGDVLFLGPSPTFLPRTKGVYSYQIILKAKEMPLAKRNKLLAMVPSDWEVEIDSSE